jgi:putative membrane protein insertion efficiency factor
VQSELSSPAASRTAPGFGSAIRSGIASVLVALLTGYKRLISPILPSACRFYPTCSVYMREAILLHGSARGVWLGLRRLGRCHPFHEGGADPVPDKIAR